MRLRVSRRRRVLMTTDALGGVWRYNLELAAVLDADIVLAVLGPEPDFAQCREAAGLANVELVMTALPLDWTAPDAAEMEVASDKLAELARRESADIVHLHAPGFVGCANWPAPVVTVAHSCVATWWQALRGGPLPPDLAWRAAATADGLRRAAAAIVPSHAFAQQLRGAYGRDLKLQVVHNGRRVLPYPLARRQRTVLSLGRQWDDAKNFAALDRCAALLDVPVLLAGPPSLPGQQAPALRNLRGLGVLDEGGLAKALARAGVFVSLALYEPFGLAILEAAQSGAPLVLADIPTFHELWEGAAIFVDPADAAVAIRSLLDNPDQAKHLGEQARERALQYSATGMGMATAAVHDMVLRTTSRRAA